MHIASKFMNHCYKVEFTYELQVWKTNQINQVEIQIIYWYDVCPWSHYIQNLPKGISKYEIENSKNIEQWTT